MDKNNIDLAIALTLPLGLALESSIPLKPGNVYPGSGYSDLSHKDFLISSVSMSLELYRILSSLNRYYRGVVGETIYRLSTSGYRLHGEKNVNLGFSILISPIAICAKIMVKDMLSERFSIDDLKKLLMESRNLAMDPKDYDSVEWIRNAIIKASPKYLSRYIGRGIDIFSKESRSSLRDFIEIFKDHDIVIYEVYIGYRNVFNLFEEIVDHVEEIDYSFLRKLFIDLGSRAIDTHIARGKGYKYAYKVQKAFKIAREIKHVGLKEIYLESLDRDMKTDKANPGSIADILACSIGVAMMYRYLARS